MRLSQVSFNRYVNVPGVGLRDGFMSRTPGIKYIDLADQAVTIVAKTGEMVMVPWSACTEARAEETPQAPAKK